MRGEKLKGKRNKAGKRKDRKRTKSKNKETPFLSLRHRLGSVLDMTLSSILKVEEKVDVWKQFQQNGASHPGDEV